MPDHECCRCERGECRWMAELTAEVDSLMAQVERQLAAMPLAEIALPMTDREVEQLIKQLDAA